MAAKFLTKAKEVITNNTQSILNIGRRLSLLLILLSSCSEKKEIDFSKVNRDKIELPETFYLAEKMSMFAPDLELMLKQIIVISDALEIPPEWLMAIIYSESQFNALKENPDNGRMGLIQFTPEWLATKGLSKTDINQMSYFNQLDLVYEYLAEYKPEGGYTFETLFVAVVKPEAIGKDPEEKIFSNEEYPSEMNLDEDRNGEITGQDIDRRLGRSYPRAYNAHYIKSAISFEEKYYTME